MIYLHSLTRIIVLTPNEILLTHVDRNGSEGFGRFQEFFDDKAPVCKDKREKRREWSLLFDHPKQFYYKLA